MAFIRFTNDRKVRLVVPTSGSVITVNDVIQYDENGAVVVAATGAEILGLALQASASGNTDAIQVDVLHGGDIVQADISTGTMGDTEVGEEADLEDEDSLTLTESNNDFLITDWDGSDTTVCRGVFKNLAFEAS